MTERGEHRYDFNQRLYLPAYTYADAGRYAQTSAQNVRRWFQGQTGQGRMLHPVFAGVPKDGLSYIQLIEVAFVAAMRKRDLPLDEMRRAYKWVREKMGVHYPFAEERFATDGINLFIEALDNTEAVVAVSKRGQLVMRRILEEVAGQLDYEETLAVRWHLRGRNHPILINPRVSFGRPIIEGTGIPTRIVVSRIHAGDSKEFVARDFDLTAKQVEEALWFEEQLKNA